MRAFILLLYHIFRSDACDRVRGAQPTRTYVTNEITPNWCVCVLCAFVDTELAFAARTFHLKTPPTRRVMSVCVDLSRQTCVPVDVVVARTGETMPFKGNRRHQARAHLNVHAGVYILRYSSTCQ